MTVQAVTADRAELGESPVWSAAEGALYWVDLPRSLLHRLRWDGGAAAQGECWTLPDWVTSVAPRARGGVVLTLRRRVALFDPGSATLDTLCTPDPTPGNRSNEARTDPRGRLWLGTMQNNLSPEGADLPLTRSSGSLYRIEADGESTAVLTGLGIPNGLAWAPDGQTLYLADSLRGGVSAYAFDAQRGSLSHERPLAPFARGVPDGSAVDEEGGLWNARWGGGCVIRFAPDGTVDRVVELPVTNPSSCTFGGPERRQLYVTSARSGLDAAALARNPLEGALLQLDVGVRGWPPTPFAG